MTNKGPSWDHCTREELEEMLDKCLATDTRTKLLLGDRHYSGRSVENHVKDLLEEINTLQGGLLGYSEFTGIRPSVLTFAIVMEDILQVHDDTRGEQGWLEEDLSYLYELYQMAHGALSNAIMADNINEILSKSTDVANYIMMIHDKIRDKTGRRANDDKNLPTD